MPAVLLAESAPTAASTPVGVGDVHRRPRPSTRPGPSAGDSPRLRGRAVRHVGRHHRARRRRASARLIGAADPAARPGHTRLLPVKSNMAHYASQGGHDRVEVRRVLDVRKRRVLAGSSGRGRSAPCPDPLQHTCGRPRMQAAASTSSHRTGGGHLAHQRLDGRRRVALRLGVDVGHDRHARVATPPAPAARAPAASSAGFISAQWNGALTGSGIARLAPSCLGALAGARHGVLRPGDDDLARRVQVRRADHLALRRLLRTPGATVAASSPRMAAIAPCPTGTASCM